MNNGVCNNPDADLPEPALPFCCTKVLPCGHACLESPYDPQEPCSPCRQYIEFPLPCGHTVFGYCGKGPKPRYICQGNCGKKRRCGHPCVKCCGAHSACDTYSVGFQDCDFCEQYKKARGGEIEWPTYFMTLDNGIKDDDEMGPVFREECFGMTPEQVAHYRALLNRIGIRTASDHPKYCPNSHAY